MRRHQRLARFWRAILGGTEVGKLTFKELFRPKLLDKSKKQTLRRHRQRGDTLHIWCPDPRNNPNAVKLGISKKWTQVAIRGRDVTDEIAWADGFNSRTELIDWFMKTYDDIKSVTSFNMQIIYKINWEWTDGPNA